MNPLRSHPTMSRLLAAVLLACVVATPGSGGTADGEPATVPVPAGVYRPLFRGPDDLREVPVAAFHLDTAPVTNGEYLEFVRANPRWQRSRVVRLFANENYLRHWAGDLDLGPDADTMAARPVTWVSWFAAKAFTAWRGGRLPTTAEWEWVAAAGFDGVDGRNEPEFMRAVARWYSQPTPPVLPPAGSGRPNSLGIRDLHGVVWEWTSDYNTSLVTGDSRGDTGIERQLFCGAGSQGAADRANFPAFMRAGFRSSLKAAYTVHNLGFRCAYDRPPPTPTPTPAAP